LTTEVLAFIFVSVNLFSNANTILKLWEKEIRKVGGESSGGVLTEIKENGKTTSPRAKEQRNKRWNPRGSTFYFAEYINRPGFCL
jgi:hypothetical protein